MCHEMCGQIPQELGATWRAIPRTECGHGAVRKHELGKIRSELRSKLYEYGKEPYEERLHCKEFGQHSCRDAELFSAQVFIDPPKAGEDTLIYPHTSAWREIQHNSAVRAFSARCV